MVFITEMVNYTIKDIFYMKENLKMENITEKVKNIIVLEF